MPSPFLRSSATKHRQNFTPKFLLYPTIHCIHFKFNTLTQMTQLMTGWQEIRNLFIIHIFIIKKAGYQKITGLNLYEFICAILLNRLKKVLLFEQVQYLEN